MSRPIIHCPSCGRDLYSLRRPQCLWCGARIPQDQFAQVAAPAGIPPPAFSPPLPPLPGMPLSGRSQWSFDGNPFPLIKRFVSPWERRLRIAGAAIFVIVMLARLAEIAWNVWKMSHMIPPGR